MILSLSRGLTTEVSDSNPLAVQAACHKWYAHRTNVKLRHGFYAARKVKTSDGRYKILYLHRVLMMAPEGVEVDHRDGNKLRNTDDNLRLVNRSQQSRGFKTKAIGKTSTFRGVSFHRRVNRWQASIHLNGKTKALGYFNSEIEAARAYNEAASNHAFTCFNRV